MGSYCIFGDSIAKGLTYNTVSKRYAVSASSGAALFSGMTGNEVRNYACVGCTVKRGQLLLGKHLDDLHRYDRVVLEVGGNDCDFNWAEVASAPESEHLPKVPLTEFRREYAALIDTVRAHGGRPLLLNLPPLHAVRFFRWVSQELDQRAILRWLGDVGHIYRWQEQYNLAVHSLAQEKQAPLVDIRSVFLAQRSYGAYLCDDGMHPNEAGQSLIAHTLAAYWRRSLSPQSISLGENTI